MADASYLQTSFLGGEWSSRMQGRLDLPKYRFAMTLCLNGIPVEEGAWMRRSGTAWLGTTRSGVNARVMGWEFQEGFPMFLEFTDGHMRAFQGAQFGSPTPVLSLLQTDGRNMESISTATPALVTVLGNISWATGDQVMFGHLSSGLTPLANRLFTITVVSGISPSTFTIADAVTGAPIDGTMVGYSAGQTAGVSRIADVVTPYTGGSWESNRLISLGEQTSETFYQIATSEAIILNGSVQPQLVTATMFNASGGDVPVLTLAPAAFSDGPYLDVINGAQMLSTVSANSGIIAPFPGWNGGGGGTTVNVGELVQWGYSASTPAGYNFVCIQTQPDSGANFPFWFTSYPTSSAYYKLVTDTAPFATYNSATAYSVAQVVEFNNNTYVCIKAGTNHEPDVSPTFWTQIALESTASLTGQVTFDLSFSLWSSTTTYNTGDVSSFNGVNYQSLQDNNIGQEPDTSAAYWVSGVNSGLPFNTNGASSTDIGRAVRLFFQPAPWNSVAAYQQNDLVTYQGAYYQAQQTNTSQSPNVNQPPGSSIAYWLPVTGAGIAAWTWGIVTAVNSATEIVLNIVGDALLYPSNAIVVYQVGAFSTTTGWPTCGIFYQGRLWVAGALPNRVDASASGQPLVFSPTQPDGTVADNNAITIEFNSEDNELVQWLKGVQQGVLCGTLTHERLINASTQADIITPATVQENPVTRYGSAFIQPIEAGLATVFVQKFQRQIMEMVANVFSGKYNAPNLALPVKHLTNKVVQELAYQEEPTPVIWSRQADGSLIGCTYRRVTAFSTDNPALTNEPSTFAAWHRHTLGTNRTVVSITETQTPGSVLSQLAMVTKPASGSYWVEVMQPLADEDATLFDAWYLDGAIVPSSAQTVNNGTRLFGLTYATGATVSAWIGGLDCGDFVVQVGGYIDVPYAPVNTFAPLFTAAYLSGLAAAGWDGTTNLVNLDGTTPICAVVGSTFTSQGTCLRPALPQEAGAQNGPAQGKTRRTHMATALLDNAQGVSIGIDGSHFYPVPLESYTGGPRIPVTQLFSGVVWMTTSDTYTFNSALSWQVTRPYPCTVANIGGFLHTQDR